MNNSTRNRLIGIITILLIITIFFPYVLRRKSFDDSAAISLTVPTANQQQNIVNNTDLDNDSDTVSDLDMTDIPTVIATPSTPSASSPAVIDAENDAHAVAPITLPTTSAVVADKNYSIQLVALKNKQKIEELVALLRLHNYDVYTDPKDPAENQIIRLFIGPYSSKEQTELVILDLKNLTKLQGIIVAR
ncbi:SPOR domain-containing protein [Utexia brackfieldae]|uniref:SPOR domain-containing protein n=1 Tax=Utexia brackfieldae TaxID=3074108 RepID=UPI00370D1CCD